MVSKGPLFKNSNICSLTVTGNRTDPMYIYIYTVITFTILPSYLAVETRHSARIDFKSRQFQLLAGSSNNNVINQDPQFLPTSYISQ